MKKILLIIVCVTLSLAAIAQSDSTATKRRKQRRVELYGEVYDSFTKAKLKALVTLMRPDSTVIDTMTCWTWGTNSYYRFSIPAVQGHYIIKGTCEGYEDAFQDYHLRYLARNNSFELPRLLLKKKQQDDIWKESQLDGVVVRGTKVKIAYRGDTIVYNASAFNLPEGSMLDGLIRQMPGAELKDNGDIYINGKKVDYLTLNGKDFFKGQNKVMLDNLPYFTVQNIKVYDKSTKQSELIGHDVEKKDYVMDVVLKREYNRGYVGNAEAGAGTDNRYMARLFGLYYDDHSRISLFGNTNNINENRRPGGDGDWQPANMPQGLRSTRQTGLSIETEDKDKRWDENFDATLDWSSSDDQSRTASERFASEGNLLGGSATRSLQKDFRLTLDNSFSIQKPVTLWSNITLNCANGHRTTESQDSTFRTAIVNRTRNEALSRYRTLALSGNVGFHKKFPWGDFLTLSLSGNYNRNTPNEGYRLDRTFYAQMSDAQDSNELRHYYTDNGSHSYSYTLRASYTLQLPGKWYIAPSLSYSQSLAMANSDYYRLDWITEVAADQQQLEWLPSTHELLKSAIDPGNNSHEDLLTRRTGASLNIHRSTDKGYFYLDLPLDRVSERLNYTELLFDTVARRRYTSFQPSIGFYRWGIRRGLSNASYSLSTTHPTLSSLLPVDDTTNPLATTINNPHLKPTIGHNFSLTFQANNDSLRRFLSVHTSLRLSQHAIGTRTAYDPQTGAYIFEQDNIEGNWSCNLATSYEMPLDRKKRLTLQQSASADYTHSVDFDVLYLATTSTTANNNPTSTVNNWTLHERLGLEYQKDKLTVGLRGQLSWRSATADRRNFQPISAFDYNYGLHLRYTIPCLRLSLATDLHMFSRRGYSSAMMNTDDLVWNAELSRSLLKERLTLKLTAFDLLHQLSSKQYSVNAQGRTETWNNSIPRYLMCSIIYKFTQSPKKQ